MPSNALASPDLKQSANQTLSNDAARNLSRLESLLESAQLLHASLDLDDLLRHLLRTVMGRVLVGRALIAVEEDGEMRIKMVRGTAKLKCGDAFDEQAARNVRIVNIFPIGDAAHPVGILGLASPPNGAIDQDEIESLNALLGLAASGIENARAHHETQRLNSDLDQKVQELRALLDLVRGLTATLEPEAVANLLMLTLAGRWAVRRYALAAWKDSHPLVTRARGMSLPDIIHHKPAILELPEAVMVAEIPDSDFKSHLIAQEAELLFTIPGGDDTSGGIVAIGARGGGRGLAYNANDLEFGAGLVAQAGVAFENAWYVRETLERKKIEQELELAASIQEKLFPETLPALAGYDLAARNRPARQCGGDYYDVLPIVNTATDEAEASHLICVADVSGKGLPASLLMSNMQASLRALLSTAPTLPDLASRANNLLHATTPSNKYVTAVLVRLDPATGHVAYVNAGHNGGLLLRCNGEHEWFKPTGTPIGLFPDMPYTESIVTLEHGDMLALFSDGFPEAQDTASEEYGEDRLLAYLQSVCDEPAAEIVARAFNEIDNFAGAAPQFDDITLFVIKRAA
ncbi:MAG: PP2C family protein-serine/threonine phosphatase [Pyrinomonadaceae bacterium MAG19_C2-C3]|nr:PP2C family protein-serine/threonine phosphatase [Pyrinomonadaceae bacterium MAG19_C2-C3]